MDRNQSDEQAIVRQFDLNFVEKDEVHRRATINDDSVAPRGSYMVELSGQPIPLEYVEFCILRFLARSPYRAFSPRQICAAVNSGAELVSEDDLGGHIASLRGKLGIFSDYVKTVPYVGYRFKE